MSDRQSEPEPTHVVSINAKGASPVILVCEHASHHIPAEFEGLGLSQEARKSHAAWDPGAMDVATRLAQRLDAELIASGVSRLVYDCNRPPTAPDAMPARSEVIDVPGNIGLTQEERDARTDRFYRPFQTALGQALGRIAQPILITIHSFTPVFHGIERSVEIGVLHDSDARLADAMLQTAADHTRANVQRNAPYGPDNGVTHTLKVHAIPAGHLNVMLEIRNDLIEGADAQGEMAEMLSDWIKAACAMVQPKEGTSCQA